MQHSSIARFFRRLGFCARGSSDLTVGLLMTAAGAAMVGLTVPSLFKSSDTAARTFDRQVKILERGTSGGAGGGGGSSLSSLPSEGAAAKGFEFGGEKNVGLKSGSVAAPKGDAVVTPSTGAALTTDKK